MSMAPSAFDNDADSSCIAPVVADQHCFAARSTAQQRETVDVADDDSDMDDYLEAAFAEGALEFAAEMAALQASARAARAREKPRVKEDIDSPELGVASDADAAVVKTEADEAAVDTPAGVEVGTEGQQDFFADECKNFADRLRKLCENVGNQADNTPSEAPVAADSPMLGVDASAAVDSAAERAPFAAASQEYGVDGLAAVDTGADLEQAPAATASPSCGIDASGPVDAAEQEQDSSAHPPRKGIDRTPKLRGTIQEDFERTQAGESCQRSGENTQQETEATPADQPCGVDSFADEAAAAERDQDLPPDPIQAPVAAASQRCGVDASNRVDVAELEQDLSAHLPRKSIDRLPKPRGTIQEEFERTPADQECEVDNFASADAAAERDQDPVAVASASVDTAVEQKRESSSRLPRKGIGMPRKLRGSIQQSMEGIQAGESYQRSAGSTQQEIQATPADEASVAAKQLFDAFAGVDDSFDQQQEQPSPEVGDFEMTSPDLATYARKRPHPESSAHWATSDSSSSSSSYWRTPAQNGMHDDSTFWEPRARPPFPKPKPASTAGKGKAWQFQNGKGWGGRRPWEKFNASTAIGAAPANYPPPIRPQRPRGTTPTSTVPIGARSATWPTQVTSTRAANGYEWVGSSWNATAGPAKHVQNWAWGGQGYD